MQMWYNKEQPKTKEEAFERWLDLVDTLRDNEQSIRDWLEMIEDEAKEQDLPKVEEAVTYILMELSEISDSWKEMVLLTLQATKQNVFPKKYVSE